MLQGGRGAVGADELFPVFVYVVLQCNPRHLASNLAYVQRFRSPMALKSESGCYFTHLQAAVSFLDDFGSPYGGEGDAEGSDAGGRPARGEAEAEAEAEGAGAGGGRRSSRDPLGDLAITAVRRRALCVSPASPLHLH